MKVRSGIDTVYIPRIVTSLERSGEAFIDKCCTQREKEYAYSHKSEARQAEIIAGRFAAKEAVAKALGTGILTDKLALTDVEVLPGEGGAPAVSFYGKARELIDKLHVVSSSVSITHEKDYATAICVLLTDEEDI